MTSSVGLFFKSLDRDRVHFLASKLGWHGDGPPLHEYEVLADIFTRGKTGARFIRACFDLFRWWPYLMLYSTHTSVYVHHDDDDDVVRKAQNKGHVNDFRFHRRRGNATFFAASAETSPKGKIQAAWFMYVYFRLLVVVWFSSKQALVEATNTGRRERSSTPTCGHIQVHTHTQSGRVPLSLFCCIHTFASI